MSRYGVVYEADRKRRYPNIVPEKTDDKADRVRVERKSPNWHIWAMSRKPNKKPRPGAAAPAATESPADEAAATQSERPREIGGPPGPEPTRYGDWEFNGRCTDF